MPGTLLKSPFRRSSPSRAFCEDTSELRGVDISAAVREKKEGSMKRVLIAMAVAALGAALVPTAASAAVVVVYADRVLP